MITNIQFDHQAWLGETIDSIAFEKAGIIKPNLPVLTAAEDSEALAVLRETAERKSAPFTIVTTDVLNDSVFRSLAIPLAGVHQRLNAALAIETARVLRPTSPVSDAQIVAGINSVHWLGRLQSLERANGSKIILDGAHNLAGAATLRNAIESSQGLGKATLILGILSDKDCAGICHLLAPLANKIYLPPVKSKRSAHTEELARACAAENPQVPIFQVDSLSSALRETRDDALVVIAGSLYLIGEALELLDPSAAKTPSEAYLNEWSAATVPSSKE